MATAKWPPLAGVPSGPGPEPRLLDASHLALLLDLSRALSGAPDFAVLPSIAVQRVRLLTGAVLVRLGQPGGAADLAVVAESSAAERAPETPATASAPEREVLRTRAPVWIGTPASAKGRFAGDPLLARTSRATAWAFLPLIADDQLSGVLGLAFDRPRGFDEVTRAFLAEVASECANALARGSVFARERARAEARAVIRSP